MIDRLDAKLYLGFGWTRGSTISFFSLTHRIVRPTVEPRIDHLESLRRQRHDDEAQPRGPRIHRNVRNPVQEARREHRRFRFLGDGRMRTVVGATVPSNESDRINLPSAASC